MASNSMVPTQLRRQVLRILNKLDDRRYLDLDEAGEKLFTIADKKTLLERVDRDILIRVSSEMMNNVSQEEVKKK